MAITGASSGIGADAARAFAAQGCRLALAARNEVLLEQVAADARGAGAAEVRTRRVDVTRAADVDAWARDLAKEWDGVDVLVANAGVGHFGAFLDADLEQLEQLVATNVVGVWRTTLALAPLLDAARGHLIVVGSVAGRVPLPYLAAYAGTKSALLGWTRSVRPELRRRGIAVTLFCPGATRTQFAANALHVPGIVRGDLDEHIGRGQTSVHVAKALVRAARWRPREVYLGVEGRLGVLFSHVVPHVLARGLEPFIRPRRRVDGRSQAHASERRKKAG